MFLFITFLIINNCNNIFAYTKYVGISAFPASYQVYLKQLNKSHPTWTFTALNTGLDWNTVVKNQSHEVSLVRSAVPSSYEKIWKYYNSSGNVNSIETGWVTASKLAVGYTMDPRRYLNEMQMFQFETLNYNSSLQNEAGVEKIFYGTLMYQKTVSYKDDKGNTITPTPNKTYAKLVMEAASKYNVSPYHLASRIRQETSCDIISNTSICGTVKDYEGLYNYFNIGATGGASPAISGLAYARNEGWTTPALAIDGGANFIASKYISKGQYTGYLQKFNVNPDSDYALYTHQYMQNILAPAGEAISTYNAYKEMGIMNTPFNFVIPVYTNMPTSPVDIYVSNPNDYIADSTKIVTTENLNIRSGPGIGYSIILNAKKGTVMTRISKGVQAGERWDKVRLDSGVEAYAFQAYTKEHSYTKVSSVSLNNTNTNITLGENKTLTATVNPSGAAYKGVYWTSNNNDIISVSDTGVVTAKKLGSAIITVTTEDQLKTATCVVNVAPKKEPVISLDKTEYSIINGKEMSLNVTIENSNEKDYTVLIDNQEVVAFENGKLIGKKAGETNITVKIKGIEIKTTARVKVIDIEEGAIVIDESLNVDGDVITKINPETKVTDIVDKIATNYDVIIKDNTGKTIENENLVGTGSKIIIKEGETTIYEYTVVIYGDIDGNGIIDAVDLLRLKRHITGANILSGVMYKSASISRDGTEPNAVDLLRIKRQIVGTTIIVQ